MIFYYRTNYHDVCRYLKQSIPAPAKGHFIDLRWHPEETGRLYLTTASTCFLSHTVSTYTTQHLILWARRRID